MRIIDKLVPFLSLSLTTAVMAQLPFFLQRFMPKQGLLGSGSSAFSQYSPLSSSSILSFNPLSSASNIASLLGAASNTLGTSLPFSSQSGSLPFGSSGLGSSALGSLGLGSSFLPQSLSSDSSYIPSSLGSGSFASSFGSSAYVPSSGSSGLGSPLFSSASFAPQGSSGYSSGTSGLGSPLFSSASFGTQGSSGYSPFGSASYNSPSILGASSVGQRFEPSSFGSSSLSEFGHSGNFDGLGGYDPIDLIEDYPGFSNAGFGKDLNYAGSQAVKFHAPSTLGNEYNSYLKRSSKKK